MAFDMYWRELRPCSTPFAEIAKVLSPPVPVRTVMSFSRLMFVRYTSEMDSTLLELIRLLDAEIVSLGPQTNLAFQQLREFRQQSY
jgi:hypothetical protein